MTAGSSPTHRENRIPALGNKLAHLSFLCAIVMALLVTADVLCRFALHRTITGVLEIEESLMAILVFSSFAFIQNKKAHIRIDIFLPYLSSVTRTTLDLFAWLLGAIFYGVMAWRLGAVSLVKYASGEHTVDLHIPVFIFQGVAAFCVAVFALTILEQAVECVRRLAREGRLFPMLLAFAGAAALFSLPWWFRALDLGLARSVIGGLGMGLLMILIFLSVPIGFAMGVTGLLGMLTLNLNLAAAFSAVGLSSYAYATSYILSVIPMFCLMGEIAFHAGISRDLFATANTWLGRQPGGLAIAGVAGCTGFAAVCGDSLATAVTMGSVALPEMRAKKYDPGLACASLAAGGTLGILIPPSIGFIFYSIITEESVGRLFMAGVLPGLLLASFFMGILYVIAVFRPHLAPRGDKTTFREKFVSLKGIFGMLLLIFLIMGGILSGLCTPTEGGAVGAVGALLLTLKGRRLSMEGFKASLVSTAEITGKLMLILVGVNLLGSFFASTRLPLALADLFAGMDANRYVIFACVVVFYIVMGCVMNVLPLMLLTLPAIYPTVLALQFDPVWFGVAIVILMEMGQITPPVGVNVFAISSVARDVPMERIFASILPFFGAMLLCILFLVLFPQLALWLPDTVFGPRLSF